MTVDPLIQSLKGKLVVSVQAYMGEPLRTPETMAQMSRACELGGAREREMKLSRCFRGS